ncbi:hypothetical protein [Enterovirga rhinocerotis]|uniref:Uncharacterized protein n=1 Tax=Enterovirga rhinocerotis TaxID=1339210 RepID=A0A4R7BXP0_9HYPH|nr:hypothetical protein [Enterovirga rhinocerotis]TDR90273.1 hypothetical protein EV668_3119 [Enterovirga rhinocerotis]
MNPGDILTGLISLFGAGGFTAIVVGYLAYKKEAATGRREPLKPETLPTANGHFPGSHDIELLVQAITLLTAALTRCATLLEAEAHDREMDEEAEKRAEMRELREIVRAMRQARTA